jgi:hypothetical protein
MLKNRPKWAAVWPCVAHRWSESDAKKMSLMLTCPAGAIENGDHTMIEQVNVTNFRCFQKLEVPNIKKINLLVGPNSSGKSAFLESLFLSSASNAPAVAFQLRAIRRMGNQIMNPVDSQAYRGLWEDLFYNFNEDKKVSIKIAGNPSSDSRSLSIEYSTPLEQELPFGKQADGAIGNVQQSGAIPQIEFKWKRSGHQEVLTKPKFTSSGLQFEIGNVNHFPAVWFTPGAGETPDENSRRFSEVSKRGESDVVIATLQKDFPFIRDLSIQYHAGLPMVFAKVDGKARLMPIALLSDGINRLLGICLGLVYFKGGTVLIDQLEDGFHYKILPSIWNSVFSLAEKFKVQVFASTHSKECLDAMLPVMRGHEDSFCLLKASRKDDGCTVQSLTGDYLETALEQDFEVR